MSDCSCTLHHAFLSLRYKSQLWLADCRVKRQWRSLMKSVSQTISCQMTGKTYEVAPAVIVITFVRDLCSVNGFRGTELMRVLHSSSHDCCGCDYGWFDRQEFRAKRCRLMQFQDLHNDRDLGTLHGSQVPLFNYFDRSSCNATKGNRCRKDVRE